ncbi:uncharacterized protein [Elaeis guineensis]|uniref:Vacuolar ATPase assembly integral membrane protein VMA21 homolog n=1 Tax=Elaeis guineensis var. tenera TaxID=51953 RepID=A0A6I9QS75_ELAGV|nr:uncharacterized protein LOC105039700 [Elaeis guineensis]XP_010914257.1 uncharacterized protein LOC105039700 [Elaeis guineensis]
MLGVMQKFVLASMIMLVAPIAILYRFNYHIFPGSGQLSVSSQTLLSGFLAVISVNLVIVLYIIMATKEPANHEPQPDPAFLAKAKASINQSGTTRSNHDAQPQEKAE